MMLKIMILQLAFKKMTMAVM